MSLNLNLEDFVELSPENTARASRPATDNPIFVTIKPNALQFSQGTIHALESTGYVKVMLNTKKQQFVVMQSEDGFGFFKAGRKRGAYIIWTSKAIVGKVKDMLPDDRKENVRVYGSVFEQDDGTKGIVFDCKDLGEMRKLNR